MKEQPMSKYGTSHFDLKSQPKNHENHSRVNALFPARSKNQIRKVQEDLDLVTSYFNKESY